MGLILYGSSKGHAVQDLGIFHHAPSHSPPTQKNDTNAEVRWYSDLKWLKPFSASVSLEEDRSVLPPIKSRPPIYTFYDSEEKKEEKVRVAENKLLLLWRRAWWAQGFRPVVLGRSEAMNNPLYENFQEKELQPQLEVDLVRWLAWGQMGTGILANWLVLPMGPREEHTLSYLRRGDYSTLSRYEGLASGLYSGEKAAINGAISEALNAQNLKDAKALGDLVSRGTILVEPKPSELAFYDANTNAEHYKPITAALAENKAKGLLSLAELVNSHLHLTFLNAFPAGFAILSPYIETTAVVSRTARALAEALRSCPSSPIPSSCPPNDSKCVSCVERSKASIATPKFFSNASDTYTIGTIPHPFTFASLNGKTKDVSTRHIRRDTSRDPWLSHITQKTLGLEVGGQGRIVSFKSMVAGEWGSAHSIWMTETAQLQHKDLEYHFGFVLPPFNITKPEPLSAWDDSTSTKERKQSAKELQNQQNLLDAVREVLKMRRPKGIKTSSKEMVEAWNLADTEAWRFVRAFAARERLERKRWEEEERKFAGGDEGEEEKVWRWFDRR